MNKKWTISFLSLYFVLLISKKIEWYFPDIINNYLSDLLCIPIILSIARWSIVYIKNDVRIRISPLKIFFTVVVTGVLFEYYLPRQSDVYTSDVIDFFMYSLGGFIYYFLEPPLLKSNYRSGDFSTSKKQC